MPAGTWPANVSATRRLHCGRLVSSAITAGALAATTVSARFGEVEFGFVVADQTDEGWQLSFRGIDGTTQATCDLTDSGLACDS